MFGIFFYAIERGFSVERARTMVVNTIVVMEAFYLFSVRYIHGSSLTWQGVLGTPAVLIALVVVVVAQLAFTYLPVMQDVFGTEPIAPVDGALIVGIGVALLIGGGDREEACRGAYRPESGLSRLHRRMAHAHSTGRGRFSISQGLA